MLTGILVRFGEGKLVMAATDSYRLSYKETPARPATSPELEAIVPARALDEVRRLATAGGTIELGVQENQVVVRRRRHLADHAPHRRAVPEVRRAAAEGVQARGHAAARRAARGRPPHVGDGAPQLAAAAALRRGRGDGLDADRRTSARHERRCRSGSSGEPLEIGFNADFLRDGIESADGEEVRAAPDRSAAAGADPGPRRRLLVPDHADPARRLIVSVGLPGELPLVRARWSSRSSRASCSRSARTAPARRTCSSRCTSARRASRRGRAPTPS